MGYGMTAERGSAMNDKAYLSIRMNRELHDKFQSVAAYEGRSMSGQILYLVNQSVLLFKLAHALDRKSTRLNSSHWS